MKKFITTMLVAAVMSSSAFACTPRYTSNIGNIMAQVRMQSVNAGTASKNNTGNNSYLQAALDAAGAAGAATGSVIVSGQ